MYQNSPIAMQNSKKFPCKHAVHRTPVLGERKVGFISPEMYQNAPTEFRIPKISRTPEPPFLERRAESCLLLKLCLATPLKASHIPHSGAAPHSFDIPSARLLKIFSCRPFRIKSCSPSDGSEHPRPCSSCCTKVLVLPHHASSGRPLLAPCYACHTQREIFCTIFRKIMNLLSHGNITRTSPHLH